MATPLRARGGVARGWGHGIGVVRFTAGHRRGRGHESPVVRVSTPACRRRAASPSDSTSCAGALTCGFTNRSGRYRPNVTREGASPHSKTSETACREVHRCRFLTPRALLRCRSVHFPQSVTPGIRTAAHTPRTTPRITLPTTIGPAYCGQKYPGLCGI